MAHSDLDLLLNALIPTARGLLEKHGSFHPFAAYLDRLGEVVPVEAQPEAGESPQIIDEILGRLGMEVAAGNARAAAVCMDVLVVPPDRADKVDAIGLRLEHEAGEAVEVYLPYRREARPELLFDELFATPGYRRLWGAGEPASSPAQRFGFPDDLDGRTLGQLAQSGSDLGRPHRFEFFLYFHDRAAATRVGGQLESEGFGVELRSDEAGAEWLVLATLEMPPEHDRLVSLRERFEELCAREGGDYDGWGAPVV
ncbi:MAG: ribonuclease E inhibitor RraB [Planctomycetes bacterium]|nr:ribonuclease E inhibitor RraB [Planctomycetota bacterium]